MKDNRLIALFMGYKETEGSKGQVVITHPEYGTLAEKGLYLLKYHSSWDWLMPVVEKIETMDNYSEKNEIDIFGNCCDIGGVIETIGETKIQAVYKAVVEFIEKYNKCQTQ